MVHRTGLALALAVASSILVQSPARGNEPPSAIPIVLFDSADLDPAVLAEARREAGRILAAAKLRPYWLDLEPGWDGDAGDCLFLRVIVRRQAPRQWGLPRSTLGATLSSDPSNPTIYLFSEPIRDTLTRSRRRGPVPQRRLARALGRVLVHEIVHALSSTTPHAHHRIMAPTQDRATLTGAKARLDRRSAEELHHAVAAARHLCRTTPDAVQVATLCGHRQ